MPSPELGAWSWRPGDRSAGAKYLLSGLGTCSCCGGGMVVRALSADHAAARRYSYTCNYAYNRGRTVCTNRLGAAMDDADRVVLAAVARDVLHPDVVVHTLRKALMLLSRPDDPARRDALQTRVDEITTELVQLATAVARAGNVDVLADAIRQREAARIGLRRELAALDQARGRRVGPPPGGA